MVTDVKRELIFQELHSSTGALAVMSDATSRTIDEMSKWSYDDKLEMKLLGGTLSKMRENFVEFLTLGISKMVEDFFNNLKLFGNITLGIWDSSCDSVEFLEEVRLIRHLGNVIKHNNSIIDYTKGGSSSKALVDDYGFPDNTPIYWLDIFQTSKRDSILKYIYMANQFCTEILIREGLPAGTKLILKEEEMVAYLLKHFVHSIPGHPEK